MQNKIIELVKNTDAILITAGAGMGVDSGLPDFRGNEGFWRAYPAIKKLGESFEDMANPKWFDTNPQLAWAFYGHRLNLYRETTPHEGFSMLLDLVKKKNDNYFVFTSNVDGQFQKAGFDKKKIVEVHGSIQHFQCSKNCTQEIWEAPLANIDIDMELFNAHTIPKCPNCGAVARPNILMFGDWNWIGTRSDKQEDSYYKWREEVIDKQEKIVIIEIGAGIAIPTIRNHGEMLAKKYKNATLIRINPRDDYLNPYLGYSIKEGGLDGIKKIIINE
ncbi:NAD-dependent deacetylase [Sulfurimonas sp. NW15]|uniref:SIR2 family NAD-dependent protein deacylase n=1 Tax=Sulfurimonas sp. NW15 TaxID=2922729 RepID=UPI003DA894AD